jgi:phospholipid transport system substrate-binding protein
VKEIVMRPTIGISGGISGLRDALICFAAAAVLGLNALGQENAPSRDVETFTQNLIDRGFAILRDDSVGDAARRARFHQFVVQNVDARKTALFTLGRHRRGVSDALLEQFVVAFRDFATATYELRLEERKDATLKVTNSVQHKAGDFTVNAEASDPDAKEPVKIAFRLLGLGGNYKVVDVQVAGVWISIDQRDQFEAILSKNGGDVKALISHLITQTASIRDGK